MFDSMTFIFRFQKVMKNGDGGHHMPTTLWAIVVISSFMVNTNIFYHESSVLGDGSVGTYFNNDYWPKIEENTDPLEPTYLNPHFMHHLLPKAKLLVILRNPVDRYVLLFMVNYNIAMVSNGL